MDAQMLKEIAKATQYAKEPERIEFTSFEASFREENGTQHTSLDKGKWHCTCRIFQNWGECEHILAMQHVLGVTLLDKYRYTIQSVGSPTISVQSIRIRITEEPLTPQNIIIIFSAITELFTKCWLITKSRTADVIEYTQTHSSQFTEEVNLIVSRITYNSPLSIDWKLDASPQGLMIALATGIDAVAQAPHRVESAALDNKVKELTWRLKALEAQSEFADKEQARQITAQSAELEKQAKLLEIEQQHLEVVARRLEIEKKRVDYAFEIADKMINILRPNADEEIKTVLLQTLLPTLLQLGEGKGLELTLPVPQK